MAETIIKTETEQVVKEVTPVMPELIKVFLSYPMAGLTKDECKDIHNKMADHIAKNWYAHYLELGGKLEFIDNIEHGQPEDEEHKRLWNLGRSIQQMGQADAVFFDPMNIFAKGCICESKVARSYNIEMVLLKETFLSQDQINRTLKEFY